MRWRYSAATAVSALLVFLLVVAAWRVERETDYWVYLPASICNRPAVYLHIALAIIRRHAVMAGAVDWRAVDAEVGQITRSARTTSDTYPGIRRALDQLGDHHSFLRIPQKRSTLPQRDYGLAALYPEGVVFLVFPGSPADVAGIRIGDVIESVNGRPPEMDDDRNAYDYIRLRGESVRLVVGEPRSTGLRTIDLSAGTYLPEWNFPPRSEQIDNHLAYVEAPGTAGTNEQEYARRLRAAIEIVDQSSVCGWIVDLRRNLGGNMWPMVQALRPVLGEANPGFFVGAHGRQSWAPMYKSHMDRSSLQLRVANPSVAVLTSHLTASSGEAVAIAFRGRRAARSFGESTFGLPTSNAPFSLPDGAQLFLATAWEADRNGHVYRDRVPPDEPVVVDWRRFGTANDPVVTAAERWLRQQPQCRSDNQRPNFSLQLSSGRMLARG
jgi:carboxyl-terminal processing protease